MHTLRGRREYQEDCGLAVELGELLILGIADGFNKPGYSGLAVSKAVVHEALRYLGAHTGELYETPIAFIEAAFASIHDKTASFVAGSTFSLAIVDREKKLVTLGTVGDSIIALLDREGALIIHPHELLMERHRGLASAFGDAQNAPYRTFSPNVAQHSLGEDSVLIISSDGLYPVYPENNMEAITELAEVYTKMACEGAAPQDLTRYASETMNSPDNLTVAVYRGEQPRE